VILNEHTFEDLEHPELFKDNAHLNLLECVCFQRSWRRKWRECWGRMLFNTAPFFLFLAVVLLLFYGLPPRFRRYILLVATIISTAVGIPNLSRCC